MAETVKATRKRKPGRPPKAASGATAANDLPTQDDLVAMYRDMLLIRRFEEKTTAICSPAAWMPMV
jgi:TPP-dependent pyruvate/acetoin dehydrogenase alpha subunit